METAIIGSGNVGTALAGSFVRAGHAVTLTSTDPEEAAAVARAAGATAARSNREAVANAAAVVLAVPFAELGGIIAELGAALDGKIVIDVTNRLNLENPASVIDGTSNAEQLQALVPAARVVKAFNTVFAARQADPSVDGVPLDGFVAGDDDRAKAAVLDLVQSIGLRPIDAGPLAMARALEAMAVLNISLQLRHNWPWQTGWRLVGPTGAQ